MNDPNSMSAADRQPPDLLSNIRELVARLRGRQADVAMIKKDISAARHELREALRSGKPKRKVAKKAAEKTSAKSEKGRRRGLPETSKTKPTTTTGTDVEKAEQG